MMIKTLKRSMGVGLIEVLVSVLILSAGILGLASIHVNGIKLTNQSALRFQANVLSADIIERMRANITTANTTTAYEVANVAAFDALALGGVNCLSPGTCTVAQLAVWDLNQWKDAIELSLPTGKGIISSAGVPKTFTVTVSYVDQTGATVDVLVNVVL